MENATPPSVSQFGIQVYNIIYIIKMMNDNFLQSKIWHYERLKSVAFDLEGAKTNFAFHFKRYNLSIHVVKFYEIFWKCSFIGVRWDLMAQDAKQKQLKNISFVLCTENNSFEMFLVRHN